MAPSAPYRPLDYLCDSAKKNVLQESEHRQHYRSQNGTCTRSSVKVITKHTSREKGHSFHPPKWGAPNPRPRRWHPVEVPPRSKWQRYPSLHHQFDRNHQRNSRSLRTTSCHYPSLHSILLHHHHHHRCRSIQPSRWMTLRPIIRSFNKSWWVLRPYLTSTW